MQGFMGWTAEQGREGNWYATKFVDTEDTRRGKTGIVRMRKQLKHVKPYAPREEAEREIKRLYVKKVLR